MARRTAIVADVVDRDTLKQGLEVIENACRQAIELQVILDTDRSLQHAHVEAVEALIQANQLARELVGSIHQAMDLLEAALPKKRYRVGERIIQAQEDERVHLAREMHDGPAQSMANVVMRVEICEKLLAANRPEIVQELSQLKMLVKESLREVRKIILDLRPMSLGDVGLVPSLQRYFDNLKEQEGETIHFKVNGEPRRLVSALEVAVFRMIQEAVNNARKHAQASQVEVELEYGSAWIQAIVRDDGIGFDVQLVEQARLHNQSFGLVGMRERVELLDGQFTVASQLGAGTTVTARLPILTD